MLSEVRSLPDVWRKKTHSLARIRKESSEEFAEDYIKIWLLELNELLNVSKPMNEKQIDFTAKMILQENPLLTVADIKLVINNAASGKYGKDYNRVDSAVICEWFRKHWDERMNAAEMSSLEEHSKNKRQPDMPRVSQMEKAKFREAVAKYSQGKKNITHDD